MADKQQHEHGEKERLNLYTCHGGTGCQPLEDAGRGGHRPQLRHELVAAATQGVARVR